MRRGRRLKKVFWFPFARFGTRRRGGKGLKCLRIVWWVLAAAAAPSKRLTIRAGGGRKKKKLILGSFVRERVGWMLRGEGGGGSLQSFGKQSWWEGNRYRTRERERDCFLKSWKEPKMELFWAKKYDSRLFLGRKLFFFLLKCFLHRKSYSKDCKVSILGFLQPLLWESEKSSAFEFRETKLLRFIWRGIGKEREEEERKRVYLSKQHSAKRKEKKKKKRKLSSIRNWLLPPSFPLSSTEAVLKTFPNQ